MTLDYLSVESILALDCGSTVTQALLIDRVNADYRLVARTEAPSTVEPPWNDLMASVRQAVAQISEITDLPLMNRQGQIITPQQQTGGVDAVVVITSASPPLRLLLAGVMRDISLDSARRAITNTYATIEGLVSLGHKDEGTGSTNDDIQGQVELFLKLVPDAVVIVGGIDGGASRPVLQAAEAMSIGSFTMPQGDRPPIVYAGNTDLRSEVADIVGAETELRAIDNVRPSLELENPGPLQIELEELYRQRKMGRLPGFGTLASWSSVAVLPTAKAHAYSMQYLSQLDGINVLGVDVGGSTSTMASMVENHLDLAIRSDLGLSYNAARLLDEVPPESISRWLPFEMEPAEIRNILRNKSIHYRTLPQTREELLVEQAVAREILRLLLKEMMPRWPDGTSRLYADLLPKFHLIVGGGGVIANAPTCGQAALMLLDALQPVGVTGLVLDKARLVAPLAAVAMLNPLAAAQVTQRDALHNIGTVVAPVGSAREGETALTFKIDYDDGRSLEVEVAYGSLEVIPLATGQTADLELRPTRRFDVGLGTRGQAGTTKVEGGVLGIIIDARGRPLPIAEDPEQQREKMQRWLWDMGS
ncbi:MAG: glutamate mutase L [Anaerolineae bacterium]|jgi:hypothetical protein